MVEEESEIHPQKDLVQEVHCRCAIVQAAGGDNACDGRGEVSDKMQSEREAKT